MKTLSVRSPAGPTRVVLLVVGGWPGTSSRSPRYWALCASPPLILGEDYTEGREECKLANRLIRAGIFRIVEIRSETGFQPENWSFRHICSTSCSPLESYCWCSSCARSAACC